MKIGMIGSGYVGLVTGTCFANYGNHVICIDCDSEKIKELSKGRSVIYESGLSELLAQALKKKTIEFTDQIRRIQECDICFITVATPSDLCGKPDLSSVFHVAQAIGSIIDHPILIVTKSTVPVGTTDRIKHIIINELQKRGITDPDFFDIAANPEFLREGSAVHDFLNPDRIIVGVEKEKSANLLSRLYKPFVGKNKRWIQMDIPSAELTKYACNAILATRISFINSIAQLAEKLGAHISLIQEGLKSDPRIGSEFLFPGLGYGGSCFSKDLAALLTLAKEHGVSLPIVQAVEEINEGQLTWFFEKILKHFGSEKALSKTTIAIWGVSFKPGTDDIRKAPSLFLIKQCLKLGARIQVYDPKALGNAKTFFGDQVTWCSNQYEVLKQADALLLCTEWEEFKNPNFARMKSLMKSPVVFDGRNAFHRSMLPEKGFRYYGVGIPEEAVKHKMQTASPKDMPVEVPIAIAT